MTDDCVQRMRCAEWALEHHVDPIGTATPTDGFLLLDWPQPWPAKVEAIGSLEPVLELSSSLGIRVQLTVPQAAVRSRTAVLYHRSQGDAFRQYKRRSIGVAAAELASAALKLLIDSSVGTEPCVTSTESDLLICAHGKRDVCCGSAGTALAEALRTDSGLEPGLRVQRTSHTGGHRFAPTALLLPAGTAWAFTDTQVLQRITRRYGDVADVLPRYRGSTAMATPGLQALEREIFAQVGWGWADWQRTGEEDPDGAVRIFGTSPDGLQVAWQGHAVPGRTLPVPECRRPISQAKKSEAEVRVTGVTRVARS